MMQAHYLFCQQIWQISFIYFPVNGKILAPFLYARLPELFFLGF